MTKLEIFNRLMKKAKSNGYEGDDYRYQLGHILEGTNYYSVIFRKDFAQALWGIKRRGIDDSFRLWHEHLSRLTHCDDKWKYLEENAL